MTMREAYCIILLFYDYALQSGGSGLLGNGLL